MATNQAFDSLQYDTLALPYDKVWGDLFGNKPRIVDGQNTYITAGGKISRRPGTTQITNGTLNLRVDNIWLFETLDTPPYAFLVASCYNSSTTKWELWGQRLTSPAPGAWAQLTNVRDSNSSTFPHVASVARGMLYVKGFPASGSSEKLGSVVVMGTSGTLSVKPWGVLGPTTPARINAVATKTTSAINAASTTLAVNSTSGFPSTPFVLQVEFEQMNVTAISGSGPYNLTVTRGYNGTFAVSHASGTVVLYRNWTASGHACQIQFGQSYSYCYKTITGNYSNRAPMETNQDNAPSNTGPYQNVRPSVIVQGHADTTNIPTIAILRTTDGGGTFYLLDEITNTGAGNITYEDNKRTSGGGNVDPLDDQSLQSKSFGPSLTSNSPPPTVNAPLVVGTDTPARSSTITFFQGRHWYAIGNVVFFSALSELNLGIGEECWPSGINGNFIRFQYPVVNLIATNKILYVFTLQQTYAITGNNRETFSDQSIFENVGMPYNHQRAMVCFGEYVAFLTHDYRIAIARQDAIKFISESLGSDLTTCIEAGAEVDLQYYADTSRQHLVVFAHNKTTPTASKQFVFDLGRAFGKELEQFNGKSDEFWFTPWTIPSTAAISGRLGEGSSRRYIGIQTFKPSTPSGKFSYLDFTTPTDYTYDGTVKFDLYFVTNLSTNPPGNHVNTLRVPELSPNLYSVWVERTSYAGDSDPEVSVYADDLYTTPLPTRPAKPSSHLESIGYKSIECHFNRVAHRVAIRVKKFGSADMFEVQNLIFVFAPDSGR